MANIIGLQVFQSLLGLDYQSEEVVGILAKGLPDSKVDSLGKLHLYYELREDATFDDGTKILAKDVLFSLKVYICPSYKQTSGGYGFIEDFSLDSLNPRKFTIHCRGNSAFYKLFSGNFSILQKKVYDPQGILDQFSVKELANDKTLSQDSGLIEFASQFEDKKFAFDLNYIKGSGPYAVEEWKQGQYITLRLKKDWWGESQNDNLFFRAKMPRIRYEIIDNPITAITALKSGRIDLMKHVPAKNFAQLEGSQKEKAISTKSKETYSYQLIGFNTKKGFLKESNVRKAIAYAIPRDKIIDVVFHGQASAIYGPFAPQQEEFQSQFLDSYSFDPEKSKALLEGQDWIDFNQDGILEKVFKNDTLSLKLNYYYNADNEDRKAVGIILQDQLKQIGIELEINPVEWTVYLQGLRNGEYDIFYSGTSTLPMLPNYTRMFHSSNANGGRNYANYENAKMDSIINLLTNTEDKNEKYQLLESFTEQFLEDLPYYYLLSPKENIAYSKKLKNVSIYSLRPNYWAPEFSWE